MAVADGNGQGIGGIVRLGDLLQPQHDAGHLHHLLFDRLAVSHHQLLDLHGGVLVGGNAFFPGSQQDHPTAWATMMPVVLLLVKKSCSMAMASGW